MRLRARTIFGSSIPSSISASSSAAVRFFARHTERLGCGDLVKPNPDLIDFVQHLAKASEPLASPARPFGTDFRLRPSKPADFQALVIPAMRPSSRAQREPPTPPPSPAANTPSSVVCKSASLVGIHPPRSRSKCCWQPISRDGSAMLPGRSLRGESHLHRGAARCRAQHANEDRLSPR